MRYFGRKTNNIFEDNWDSIFEYEDIYFPTQFASLTQNIPRLESPTENLVVAKPKAPPAAEAIATIALSELNGENGFAVLGLDANDHAGISVSGAGDVNGDGFDDFLIGANRAAPNGSQSGETYLIYGSADGFDPNFDLTTLDGTNGFVMNGESQSAWSGASVSGAGDVNGDGFDDIVIGSPQYAGTSLSSGRAYVVYGSTDGHGGSLELSDLDGTNGFIVNGYLFSGSGTVVSGVGDISGDGVDDFAISAPIQGFNGNNNAGYVYLLFQDNGFSPEVELWVGGGHNFDGTNGYVLTGLTGFSSLGTAVSGVGDVNGDGLNDIIVTAPSGLDGNGVQNAGVGYVVYGGSSIIDGGTGDLTDIDGTNGFVISANAAGDQLGQSASSAGDVNGDGFDDIIIGTFVPSPNGISSGQSYVVFGTANGYSGEINVGDLDGSNGFAINGVAQGDRSGDAVSNAGDVNGDGFDDILVGAAAARTDGASGFAHGATYLVFGSADGHGGTLELSDLDGTNGILITGANSGDQSGTSVSAAGDINGDGFDDIIIGARFADNGTAFNSGGAFIVYGSPSFGGNANELTQGDDVFNGTSDVDFLDGLAGDDIINGSGGDDRLLGGSGNDQIDGGAGDDYMNGDAGNDILFGALGSDVLNGGLGFDTADYSDSAAAVVVRLFNGSGFGGDAQGDLLLSIESVEGSAFNDTLIGSSTQDDLLIGGDGNDYLGGLAGNDTLIGGVGADTLDGGASVGDTADYSDSAAAVTVRLFNGTGLGGDAEGDTLANIEGVIGTDFNDVLIGASTSSDTLEGGIGVDALFGLAGNDILIGGTGADTLDGGASLFDVADYTGSDAGVTVRLFNGTGSGGDAQGDTLANIEVIEGSAFNDTLIGSSTQIDTLIGGGGDDALFGLAGNDTLIGGGGADILDGGASNADTADYSGSAAAVTVRLYNGTGSGGDAQGDTLTNIEGITGSAHDDALIGSSTQTDILRGADGMDSLFGLAGNDILDGGNGNDSLTGGVGNDLFVFDDDFGQDTITDFTNGFDRFDVSGIAGVTSIADFTITQEGADVLIMLDAMNTITLENTLLADIDANDFVF